MGVWGPCPRSPKAEPLVRRSRGRSLPETGTFLAFGYSMDTANLLCFLKFGNLKDQILLLFLPKKEV